MHGNADPTLYWVINPYKRRIFFCFARATERMTRLMTGLKKSSVSSADPDEKLLNALFYIPGVFSLPGRSEYEHRLNPKIWRNARGRVSLGLTWLVSR